MSFPWALSIDHIAWHQGACLWLPEILRYLSITGWNFTDSLSFGVANGNWSQQSRHFFEKVKLDDPNLSTSLVILLRNSLKALFHRYFRTGERAGRITAGRKEKLDEVPEINWDLDFESSDVTNYTGRSQRLGESHPDQNRLFSVYRTDFLTFCCEQLHARGLLLV